MGTTISTCPSIRGRLSDGRDLTWIVLEVIRGQSDCNAIPASGAVNKGYGD